MTVEVYPLTSRGIIAFARVHGERQMQAALELQRQFPDFTISQCINAVEQMGLMLGLTLC